MKSQVRGLWGSEPAGRPSPSGGGIQGGWPQGPRPLAAGSEAAGLQGGLCSWARGCLSLTQCGFYTLQGGGGPRNNSQCAPASPHGSWEGFALGTHTSRLRLAQATHKALS